MTPIFITGTGTDVGKTLIAAIVTEALKADYWKPVQAGNPTDSSYIKSMISNDVSKIHKEAYLLDFPASPHISAEKENINISLDHIINTIPDTLNQLIIEGAGGIMVPLNKNEFIIDLIRALKARVIIVSSNYLGSINHSLMTAKVLKHAEIDVIGWIFNDEFMNYENDISKWSNLPKIASVKKLYNINKEVIKEQADLLGPLIKQYV